MIEGLLQGFTTLMKMYVHVRIGVHLKNKLKNIKPY
jgi:hypothetical protein